MLHPIEDWDRVSWGGYAHNDWLESVIDIGLPGGLALLCAYFLLLAAIIRRWFQRRDPVAVSLGAGVLLALIATGIHSFFDFSMRIAANSMTFAAVAGWGPAAVSLRYRNRYANHLNDLRAVSPLRPVTRILASVCVVLAAGGIIMYSVRHFLAEIKCPTEQNSTLNLNRNPYLTEIEAAIAYNPLNADYRFRKALYYNSLQISDPETFQQFNEDAVENLEAALRLNPTFSSAWYELGMRYFLKSYDSDRYEVHWLPLADRCMDAAVHLAPKSSDVLVKTGLYHVRRFIAASSVAGSPIPKEKFQELFKRALILEPKRFEWIADRVWAMYPDIEVIKAMIPENSPDLQKRLSEWFQVKDRG